MGKLIKNHLARLIVMTAAAYQIAAGVHGYFWPKIFWDMWTTTLNPLVTPAPILQTLNVVAGLFMLAWEYPFPLLVPGTAFHRSIVARLVALPIVTLIAVLLYQGTNPALYYIVGAGVYLWALNEGEVVCMPWKVPTRGKSQGGSRA
ncbi:hypothetical protein TWF173_003243 [Orbilia oligospora]|uniref:DUF7727 domain-containing protein n=2 Tax=Orbilia oligospora TaxID=2813651 RepID=G1XR69_ARTOA|nr:hypothetical protein AOL_s00193g68 [Orbilia oligospora ATCC 24927]EGX44340.1 hypothetical protein AOL_s00193g68 [Orbilia oligospora ATCC 24927]KAF3276608.1 hypothetical protein TWF970_006196 [Orbilia oligospora]KAF3315668.1 hypothetical protein TWF173_003243 [Orbilia oligospora]